MYKLHWELSSITPIDYLDQAIPRLGLNEDAVDMIDLRRRTQTILVLAITDYQFAYHPPSLLAASAILTAIQSLSTPNQLPQVEREGQKQELQPPVGNILTNPQKDDTMRELQLRLQIVTHTATVSIITLMNAYTSVMPKCFVRVWALKRVFAHLLQ